MLKRLLSLRYPSAYQHAFCRLGGLLCFVALLLSACSRNPETAGKAPSPLSAYYHLYPYGSNSQLSLDLDGSWLVFELEGKRLSYDEDFYIWFNINTDLGLVDGEIGNNYFVAMLRRDKRPRGLHFFAISSGRATSPNPEVEWRFVSALYRVRAYDYDSRDGILSFVDSSGQTLLRLEGTCGS